MRKATKKDEALIIDIISKSFYDNKSVNYVIKQGNAQNNIKRIGALVEYAYNLCINFGEIWIDKDDIGCIMFLNPNKKELSLSSVLWDAKLALNCIGAFRIGKVLGRESQIKQNYPKGDFFHLWFVGVLPEKQGNGIGSELVKMVTGKAKNENLPVYLETSMVKNLKWYKDLGFVIYKEIKFSDHNLYMLKLV